jgi:hypothetical protein
MNIKTEQKTPEYVDGVRIINEEFGAAKHLEPGGFYVLRGTRHGETIYKVFKIADYGELAYTVLGPTKEKWEAIGYVKGRVDQRNR